MNQLLFSAPSHIQIQGEQVLRFVSVNAQVAIYELVGFENFPIIFEDYRSFGLDAIQTFLMDGQLYNFPLRFNQPSQVVISQDENGLVHVELTETEYHNPPYMLWIAIGLAEAIPVYQYQLCETRPYGDDKQALFSVYKRPAREKIIPPVDFSLVLSRNIVV